MTEETPELTPELTVVIPSVNSLADLEDCLAALRRNQGARLEILVPERTGEVTRHALEVDFPEVTLIRVPPDTTIPRMRALAIARARAPAVAVIEDHVIVPEGWARAMLSALGSENHAVAGPVDNAATARLVDRAAFLCEYSAVLPPLPDGVSDWLPGNNTIYRTETLRRFADVLAEGAWENRLHDAMKAAGLKLILAAGIVAGHKMHYSFGLYMSQRFLYSRSYAGAMARGVSLPKRLVRGAASLVLLPPLQVLRILSRVRAKGRAGQLPEAIPMLIPFALSWGAGEAWGWWFGPGDALSRVR